MASPPDAATAELHAALEKCCADLARALEAAEAAGAPAGDGAPLDPADREGSAWRALTLGALPGVDQLVSTVKPPLQVIIALLQFLQALLKALAAILFGIPDPFRALILAAYALLTDIINDLLATGAYLYVDAPGILPAEPAGPQASFRVDPPKEFKAGMARERRPPVPDGFERWASRFSASFDDAGDLQRPVVTEGAPVQAAFIVMAAPSIDGLRQMLYLLGLLLNIDAFKKAFEKYAKGAPDPRRARSRGKPVAPDWRAARLVDLLPALKDLAMLPEALRGLLLAVEQLSQLIKDLAAAMQEKAQVLMKLAEAVQAIIDLLEALKSAGMYVLPVATQGGIAGLKDAFIKATNRPPGGYVGGVCLLASGPNLAKAAMLWELLGLSTAMDVMEGKLSLEGAVERAKAGALGQAAQLLEAGAGEIADAAGVFATKAAQGAEDFTEAVKNAPGDFVDALGRTPEQLEALARASREELVGMLEDAKGFLPTDENIQKGIAATQQARRRGGRSLALGLGTVPPPPDLPVPKKEQK